jgi:hypothetical protein
VVPVQLAFGYGYNYLWILQGRQPAVVAATTPKTPGATPAGRGSNLGRGPAPGRGAGVVTDSPADHHLGRRVKTRWPEDNTFYEAVITDYSAEKVHFSYPERLSFVPRNSKVSESVQ